MSVNTVSNEVHQVLFGIRFRSRTDRNTSLCVKKQKKTFSHVFFIIRMKYRVREKQDEV